MILLFDIDGTLIRCGGAGRAALEAAFAAVFGVEGALTEVRLDGSTDARIVDEAFERHFGRAATAAEREALYAAYLPALERGLAAPDTPYRVMPGAHALLEALRGAGRFALGLATGNLEQGARTKLAPGALNHFFDFGGFGGDERDRWRLVAAAMERGRAAVGREVSAAEILVLGDTELDVAAARRAGAHAVGVLAGATRPDLLAAAEPELLVESFADPRLWRHLGLGDPGGA